MGGACRQRARAPGFPSVGPGALVYVRAVQRARVVPVSSGHPNRGVRAGHEGSTRPEPAPGGTAGWSCWPADQAGQAGQAAVSADAHLFACVPLASLPLVRRRRISPRPGARPFPLRCVPGGLAATRMSVRRPGGRVVRVRCWPGAGPGRCGCPIPTGGFTAGGRCRSGAGSLLPGGMCSGSWWGWHERR